LQAVTRDAAAFLGRADTGERQVSAIAGARLLPSAR
jgi:hypothetical protein